MEGQGGQETQRPAERMYIGLEVVVMCLGGLSTRGLSHHRLVRMVVVVVIVPAGARPVPMVVVMVRMVARLAILSTLLRKEDWLPLLSRRMCGAIVGVFGYSHVGRPSICRWWEAAIVFIDADVRHVMVPGSQTPREQHLEVEHQDEGDRTYEVGDGKV